MSRTMTEIAASLKNQGQGLTRTRREWNIRNYRVLRGATSDLRNNLGVKLYAENQVLKHESVSIRKTHRRSKRKQS